MAATSTTLFPEPYAPEVGSYSSEPMPGQLAVGVADNGTEQVSERRSRPLMQFAWKSTPLSDPTDIAVFRDFVATCGSGFVNFTFYEPFVEKFGNLLVGYTDGVNSQFVIPFRGSNSWTDIKVDGVSDAAGIAPEFVSPTKEDQITLSSVFAANKPITVQNVFCRPRYICRMLTWSKLMYAQGGLTAPQFDAYNAALPVMPLQFGFSFHELL